MATYILVNIDSGNDLLPDGTKPLPEPKVPSYWCGSDAVTLEQFHWECRHCENFWAFSRLRTDFALILLISNMVVHRSFTGPTHFLSANVRGPVSFVVSGSAQAAILYNEIGHYTYEITLTSPRGRSVQTTSLLLATCCHGQSHEASPNFILWHSK